MASPNRLSAKSTSQAIHDPARRSTQQPVGLPSRELPELDPAWSRVVVAADATGTTRRWHLLDTAAPALASGDPALAAEAMASVEITLLCVHGNPTWSYLWRRVLAQAPPGWRVIAVDHLGMGYSERLGEPRSLAQRVEDLDRLTTALGLDGPVAVLAHDWGGPISLGWALRHREQLAGLVLTNTAIWQDENDAGPIAIRVARAPGVLDGVCRAIPAFVRATTALSVPPLPRAVRSAFAAPYRGRARRSAVADFVRDIPFEQHHRSRSTLEAIAAGLTDLRDLPALLVWGARDPVFSQRYLDDLAQRLPQADVQRYPDASHLVLEDRPDGVGVIWTWLQEQLAGGIGGAVPETALEPAPATNPEAPKAETPGTGPEARVPITVDLSHPQATAVTELSGAAQRSITFADLASRVEQVAAGLAARGVAPGDRVAVLVPPGIELMTYVYALWRLGAVIVIADAGLGIPRLGAALRSAGPRWVIGIPKALALVAVTRVPGERITADLPGVQGDALAAAGQAFLAEGGCLPDALELSDEADAAVLFTSGATGPPKGVVYTRAGLQAQVALLRDAVGLQSGQRLVAAFAPFALYGPALGLSGAVPDMDVTRPHTLSARALAQAIQAVDASVVFASPAALRNVVASAPELSPAEAEILTRPQVLLSAGAPVPVDLLGQVRELLPSATTYTPYGMTEALPVAMIDPTSLDSTQARDHGPGVCVGSPVTRVEVAIGPLDAQGRPAEQLSREPGVLGEIVVRGPHLKDRYDGLWAAHHHSTRPAGWHRTGDVGHLDAQGRVWVQGRLVHVLTTPDGPRAPYPLEDLVRQVPGVSDVAVVGVGPHAVQQIVVVVVPHGRLPGAERPGSRVRREGSRGGVSAMAPAHVAQAVRAAIGMPVAAVLVRDWLPVDIRHASKVDRDAVRQWAEHVLHGTGTGPRQIMRALLTGSAPTQRSR